MGLFGIFKRGQTSPKKKKAWNSSFGSFYYHAWIASALNLLAIVRGFMEYATLNGKRSFPPFSDQRWHTFLWQAGTTLNDEFPDLSPAMGPFTRHGTQYHNVNLVEAKLAVPFETYGATSDAPRIRLSYDPSPELHKELPFRYRYPGLAEKLFEVASTIPGFML